MQPYEPMRSRWIQVFGLGADGDEPDFSNFPIEFRCRNIVTGDVLQVELANGQRVNIRRKN